jgi:hypothetical protein
MPKQEDQINDLIQFNRVMIWLQTPTRPCRSQLNVGHPGGRSFSRAMGNAQGAAPIPKREPRILRHHWREHSPTLSYKTSNARRCYLAGASTNGDKDAESSFRYSRRVADRRIVDSNGGSVRASRARRSGPSSLGSNLQSVEGPLLCSPATARRLRQASGQ